jgi:hypothetical protein
MWVLDWTGLIIWRQISTLSVIRKWRYISDNKCEIFWLFRLLLSWLRHCATNWKVASSIPDDVIGIFHWHNPSDCTMALGSVRNLTEMSTRNISWEVKLFICWLSWILGALNIWNLQGLSSTLQELLNFLITLHYGDSDCLCRGFTVIPHTWSLCADSLWVRRNFWTTQILSPIFLPTVEIIDFPSSGSPTPPISCLYVIRELPMKKTTPIFALLVLSFRLVVGKIAENEVERDVCLQDACCWYRVCWLLERGWVKRDLEGQRPYWVIVSIYVNPDYLPNIRRVRLRVNNNWKNLCRNFVCQGHKINISVVRYFTKLIK